VQRAWTLGRSLVDQFAREAADLGYATTVFLHSAQYLSVPQKRDRFFMVCHDVELDFTEPTWETETIEAALARVIDAGEPLEHNLGRHRKLLSRVLPGENMSSAWTRLTPEHLQVRGDRGQVVGRPPFTIKRARAGQPAPVVMHELIHPTEHRGLSLRELATLCGYPQDYEFIDARDAGQIGRGVCPPVGKYLGEVVRDGVVRGTKIEKPYYRVVDMTRPPTKIYEVPFTSGENDADIDEET
jgi:site-specific DNA-cytosine methylase